MDNDTYIITGFGDYEGRSTVQIRYRVYDTDYDTELFIDALTGENAPSADSLTAALDTWLNEEAKPQLAPAVVAPSADLEALITPPATEAS